MNIRTGTFKVNRRKPSCVLSNKYISSASEKRSLGLTWSKISFMGVILALFMGVMWETHHILNLNQEIEMARKEAIRLSSAHKVLVQLEAKQHDEKALKAAAKKLGLYPPKPEQIVYLELP